jgi:hypothetical protein
MAESSVEAARLSCSQRRCADAGRYDDAVTDQPADAPPPGPSPAPGERRLAHPPSDRYRVVGPEPAAPGRPVSPVRGATFAAFTAVAGSALITVLGGVMAVSAGLIVVAVVTGWAVALGLRVGAGETLRAGRRVRLAVGLALVAVVLGQLGLWLYARTEGGVLGPFDYLGETFGLLVPLELAAASIAAWITAR